MFLLTKPKLLPPPPPHSGCWTQTWGCPCRHPAGAWWSWGADPPPPAPLAPLPAPWLPSEAREAGLTLGNALYWHTQKSFLGQQGHDLLRDGDGTGGAEWGSLGPGGGSGGPLWPPSGCLGLLEPGSSRLEVREAQGEREAPRAGAVLVPGVARGNGSGGGGGRGRSERGPRPCCA